jgi:hypothetical protein
MAKRILLALIVMCGHFAFGASWNGHEMIRYCGHALDDPTSLTSAQSMKTFICMGYVSGTVDSIQTFYSSSTSSKTIAKPFCLPVEGLERMQVMRVVLKWLGANRAKLDWEAPEIIKQALSEAFPCP